ncbi:MAG: S46 family peptidase [Bacteroidetes bacterium]|nr:MAG: S46 family peptidase [Bacteroidota bacterium]
MLKHIFTCLFIILSFLSFSSADEGMYPLSEIEKLNLKGKGLNVSAADIFSPGNIGLIDAIVQVGGCTGSFVSPEGLIITNHHCAFGAVQNASTTERDYITDGFLARTRAEEIPAKGYTVRITESYKDVSKEVLGAITDDMDFASRSKAIDKKIKEIVAEAEKENAGKRAEVSEMFAGKAYTLFIYTYLRDVRMVYVPQRAIGEFGGEDDNWMWPRHTGDFSFLRVYAAKDGSPADYSPENVPYHPKKFLAVNPDGVEENDAVFILGYPGRTFRHRTSDYLSFEQDIRMPYVADLFDWEIRTMEAMSKTDVSAELKLAGRIKGLANTMKNYRGKLKGLRRIELVSKKKEEEEQLQLFINETPERKAAYGTVLNDVGSVFQKMRARADYELTLDYLRATPTLVSLGFTLYDAARELQKPDLEREGMFMERNINRTKESLQLSLKNFHEPTDKVFFKEMLTRAGKLPQATRIAPLDSMLGNDYSEQAISNFVERLYSSTTIKDEQNVMSIFTNKSVSDEQMNDPFIGFARALAPLYQELRDIRRERDGELTKLYGLFVDIKQQFMKKDFIPDANSTVRLTFGKIQGYSPADALYASPFTTVRGVLDKTTGVAPFYNTPQKLIEQYKAKNLGRFKNKKLNDVPVAMLYNLDTTGGNSGSPVLNADGELIGVNFDRAFEATINDYAWNQDYSRSIAVDIRYVLWVTEKVGGADFLLQEMGVKGSE